MILMGPKTPLIKATKTVEKLSIFNKYSKMKKAHQRWAKKIMLYFLQLLTKSPLTMQ